MPQSKQRVRGPAAITAALKAQLSEASLHNEGATTPPRSSYARSSNTRAAGETVGTAIAAVEAILNGVSPIKTGISSSAATPPPTHTPPGAMPRASPNAKPSPSRVSPLRNTGGRAPRSYAIMHSTTDASPCRRGLMVESSTTSIAAPAATAHPALQLGAPAAAPTEASALPPAEMSLEEINNMLAAAKMACEADLSLDVDQLSLLSAIMADTPTVQPHASPHLDLDGPEGSGGEDQSSSSKASGAEGAAAGLDGFGSTGSVAVVAALQRVISSSCNAAASRAASSALLNTQPSSSALSALGPPPGADCSPGAAGGGAALHEQGSASPGTSAHIRPCASAASAPSQRHGHGALSVTFAAGATGGGPPACVPKVHSEGLLASGASPARQSESGTAASTSLQRRLFKSHGSTSVGPRVGAASAASAAAGCGSGGAPAGGSGSVSRSCVLAAGGGKGSPDGSASGVNGARRPLTYAEIQGAKAQGSSRHGHTQSMDVGHVTFELTAESLAGKPSGPASVAGFETLPESQSGGLMHVIEAARALLGDPPLGPQGNADQQQQRHDGDGSAAERQQEHAAQQQPQQAVAVAPEGVSPVRASDGVARPKPAGKPASATAPYTAVPAKRSWLASCFGGCMAPKARVDGVADAMPPAAATGPAAAPAHPPAAPAPVAAEAAAELSHQQQQDLLHASPHDTVSSLACLVAAALAPPSEPALAHLDEPQATARTDCTDVTLAGSEVSIPLSIPPSCLPMPPSAATLSAAAAAAAAAAASAAPSSAGKPPRPSGAPSGPAPRLPLGASLGAGLIQLDEDDSVMIRSVDTSTFGGAASSLTAAMASRRQYVVGTASHGASSAGTAPRASSAGESAVLMPDVGGAASVAGSSHGGAAAADAHGAVPAPVRCDDVDQSILDKAAGADGNDHEDGGEGVEGADADMLGAGAGAGSTRKRVRAYVGTSLASLDCSKLVDLPLEQVLAEVSAALSPGNGVNGAATGEQQAATGAPRSRALESLPTPSSKQMVKRQRKALATSRSLHLNSSVRQSLGLGVGLGLLSGKGAAAAAAAAAAHPSPRASLQQLPAPGGAAAAARSGGSPRDLTGVSARVLKPAPWRASRSKPGMPLVAAAAASPRCAPPPSFAVAAAAASQAAATSRLHAGTGPAGASSPHRLTAHSTWRHAGIALPPVVHSEGAPGEASPTRALSPSRPSPTAAGVYASSPSGASPRRAPAAAGSPARASAPPRSPGARASPLSAPRARSPGPAETTDHVTRTFVPDQALKAQQAAEAHAAATAAATAASTSSFSLADALQQQYGFEAAPLGAAPSSSEAVAQSAFSIEDLAAAAASAPAARAVDAAGIAEQLAFALRESFKTLATSPSGGAPAPAPAASAAAAAPLLPAHAMMVPHHAMAPQVITAMSVHVEQQQVVPLSTTLLHSPFVASMAPVEAAADVAAAPGSAIDITSLLQAALDGGHGDTFVVLQHGIGSGDKGKGVKHSAAAAVAAIMPEASANTAAEAAAGATNPPADQQQQQAVVSPLAHGRVSASGTSPLKRPCTGSTSSYLEIALQAAAAPKSPLPHYALPLNHSSSNSATTAAAVQPEATAAVDGAAAAASLAPVDAAAEAHHGAKGGSRGGACSAGGGSPYSRRASGTGGGSGGGSGAGGGYAVIAARRAGTSSCGKPPVGSALASADMDVTAMEANAEAAAADADAMVTPAAVQQVEERAAAEPEVQVAAVSQPESDSEVGSGAEAEAVAVPEPAGAAEGQPEGPSEADAGIATAVSDPQTVVHATGEAAAAEAPAAPISEGPESEVALPAAADDAVAVSVVPEDRLELLLVAPPGAGGEEQQLRAAPISPRASLGGVAPPVELRASLAGSEAALRGSVGGEQSLAHFLGGACPDPRASYHAAAAPAAALQQVEDDEEEGGEDGVTTPRGDAHRINSGGGACGVSSFALVGSFSPMSPYMSPAPARLNMTASAALETRVSLADLCSSSSGAPSSSGDADASQQGAMQQRPPLPPRPSSALACPSPRAALLPTSFSVAASSVASMVAAGGAPSSPVPSKAHLLLRPGSATPRVSLPATPQRVGSNDWRAVKIEEYERSLPQFVTYLQEEEKALQEVCSPAVRVLSRPQTAQKAEGQVSRGEEAEGEAAMEAFEEAPVLQLPSVRRSLRLFSSAGGDASSQEIAESQSDPLLSASNTDFPTAAAVAAAAPAPVEAAAAAVEGEQSAAAVSAAPEGDGEAQTAFSAAALSSIVSKLSGASASGEHGHLSVEALLSDAVQGIELRSSVPPPGASGGGSRLQMLVLHHHTPSCCSTVSDIDAAACAGEFSQQQQP